MVGQRCIHSDYKNNPKMAITKFYPKMRSNKGAIRFFLVIH